EAGGMLPNMLAQRIEALRIGTGQLKTKGEQMIPRAITELDQSLKEIQSYIRSGGETTSRLNLHRVATGQRTSTRAEEARLIEDGVLPVRSARRGWKQNPSDVLKPKEISRFYRHESGFPDLTARPKD